MAKAACSAAIACARPRAAAVWRTKARPPWRPTTISANLPARTIAFAQHGPKSADIYVGRELLMPGSRGGEKIHYGGGLHQVTFGPTNVGKGMRLLAPNLLSVFGKSIVVIDPKGQLAAMTALYRKHMGDEVHIIDPFGVVAAFVRERHAEFWPLAQAGLVEDAGFNPMAMLRADAPDFYDEAASIAMALIRTDAKDPHWPESARALVTGLIMWTCLKHGKAATLVQVRDWLTEADAWEEWENIDDEGNVTTYRRQVAGLRATALAMVESGHYAVRDLAGRFTKQGGSRELDSIRSSADTHTRWLLSEPLRKSLAKNTVDLHRLKKGDRPMTVYAVLPAKYVEDHSIWLRLFVSSAIRASLQSDRGWNVLFMIDEFPALGPLEVIQRQWGVARDYGIAFWAVLQDLVQLKENYPKHYQTMLSSTGCIQCFRAGDDTTAEWVSKRSGPDTVSEYSWNEGGSTGGGKPNNNYQLQLKSIEKPTIRAHWLYSLPDDAAVTYFAQFGQPAILKLPHLMTQLTSWRERSLANPYYYKPQHTALTRA